DEIVIAAQVVTDRIDALDELCQRIVRLWRQHLDGMAHVFRLLAKFMQIVVRAVGDRRLERGAALANAEFNPCLELKTVRGGDALSFYPSRGFLDYQCAFFERAGAPRFVM